MLANLIKIARLPFLVAGLVLFLLGALVGVSAGGRLMPAALLLGYIVVGAARLSVHFSNDYFDCETDIPGWGTLISGGGGVLLDHPQLRQLVRRIAVALICLSLAAGIALVLFYSLPAWTLGLMLLGNLAGWFYSAPPLRLSERGWGEACYVFAAGFVEPAIGYLVTRRSLDSGGLFFLPPLLMYGLVSILNAEIPDLEADRTAGKRNWVERMGRGSSFVVSGLLLMAAAAYFFLLPLLFRRLPVDGRILGLLSLWPAAPGLAAVVWRPAGRQSATYLATATVLTLVLFGILVNAYLYMLTRPG